MSNLKRGIEHLEEAARLLEEEGFPANVAAQEAIKSANMLRGNGWFDISDAIQLFLEDNPANEELLLKGDVKLLDKALDLTDDKDIPWRIEDYTYEQEWRGREGGGWFAQGEALVVPRGPKQSADPVTGGWYVEARKRKVKGTKDWSPSKTIFVQMPYGLLIPAWRREMEDA